MVSTKYLPKQKELYISQCHLEPLIEKANEVYICSQCRRELTNGSILHLYDAIPKKHYAK